MMVEMEEESIETNIKNTVMGWRVCGTVKDKSGQKEKEKQKILWPRSYAWSLRQI